MKMEITTKITYKYLMSKTKHDLSHMILDMLDQLEKYQSQEVESQINKALKALGKSSVEDYITWTDTYCFTCDKAVKSIDSSHWFHNTLFNQLEWNKNGN